MAADCREHAQERDGGRVVQDPRQAADLRPRQGGGTRQHGTLAARQSGGCCSRAGGHRRRSQDCFRGRKGAEKNRLAGTGGSPAVRGARLEKAQDGAGAAWTCPERGEAKGSSGQGRGLARMRIEPCVVQSPCPIESAKPQRSAKRASFRRTSGQSPRQLQQSAARRRISTFITTSARSGTARSRGALNGERSFADSHARRVFGAAGLVLIIPLEMA